VGRVGDVCVCVCPGVRDQGHVYVPRCVRAGVHICTGAVPGGQPPSGSLGRVRVTRAASTLLVAWRGAPSSLGWVCSPIPPTSHVVALGQRPRVGLAVSPLEGEGAPDCHVVALGQRPRVGLAVHRLRAQRGSQEEDGACTCGLGMGVREYGDSWSSRGWGREWVSGCVGGLAAGDTASRPPTRATTHTMPIACMSGRHALLGAAAGAHLRAPLGDLAARARAS
jgi:hypothetical protein